MQHFIKAVKGKFYRRRGQVSTRGCADARGALHPLQQDHEGGGVACHPRAAALLHGGGAARQSFLTRLPLSSAGLSAGHEAQRLSELGPGWAAVPPKRSIAPACLQQDRDPATASEPPNTHTNLQLGARGDHMLVALSRHDSRQLLAGKLHGHPLQLLSMILLCQRQSGCHSVHLQQGRTRCI